MPKVQFSYIDYGAIAGWNSGRNIRMSDRCKTCASNSSPPLPELEAFLALA
ncbi:hypothetical protein [Funiculus sociatus]|uniref:hypothetical protein n=1 Tax=Funiculus sociatus TaxID=450527 RepID=UPI0032999EB9